MEEEYCAICGKLLSNLYDKKADDRRAWSRYTPDVVFCRRCWLAPGEIAASVVRREIARAIQRIRKTEGREWARRALDSLRGSGVPANPTGGRKIK